MTSNWHAFWSSVILQMKLSMARPMFQFVIWISPLFYATITYFIYGGQSPEQIRQYVVLGSGFMALWTSIVYSSASDIHRERMYGTLENIFVAPAAFSLILAGKIAGNTLWGFFSMVLSFSYLTLLFQISIPIDQPLLFILALFTVAVAIFVFAFVMALLFTLSRQAEALMNFIEYPIFLLCGFLFPIAILPIWLQPFSMLLPPTWAIELLRAVLVGQGMGNAFLALGVITVIYSIIAYICYQAVQQKARKDGKLGVY